MKYDSYFKNQESLGWQDFLLLPYLLLMVVYASIMWLLSILPGLRPAEDGPENTEKKEKMPVIAYIFSIAVWLLFIYALLAEFNSCKAANLSFWMCIVAE